MDIQSLFSLELLYRVSEHMKSHQLSREAFADSCGLSKADVSAIFNREAIPLDNAVKVCEGLQVPMDELLHAPYGEINFVRFAERMLDMVNTSAASQDFQATARDFQEETHLTAFEMKRYIAWLIWETVKSTDENNVLPVKKEFTAALHTPIQDKGAQADIAVGFAPARKDLDGDQ